ncbi:MAG: hypothetical protein U0T74_15445 [Chitinophagales bacterium]
MINVDSVIGSGTFTSWNIGLAGDAGLTGATGAAVPEAPLDSGSYRSNRFGLCRHFYLQCID